jgi:importin subunit beta-1
MRTAPAEPAGAARPPRARAPQTHTCPPPPQVSVAGHGAAMVIAKVARIDLLAERWPDLLERIHRYVAPESPETTREHALECLGFICEEHVEATDRFPQQETNRILTSLVQGMAQGQPAGVRLAATRALCDAIEFASFNFDKEEERNYLMQMICEVMIAPDPRLRLAAYQNVNKVLELHYRYLETYISALYQLTTGAFRDTDEEVAMQVRRPLVFVFLLCLRLLDVRA